MRRLSSPGRGKAVGAIIAATLILMLCVASCASMSAGGDDDPPGEAPSSESAGDSDTQRAEGTVEPKDTAPEEGGAGDPDAPEDTPETGGSTPAVETQARGRGSEAGLAEDAGNDRGGEPQHSHNWVAQTATVHHDAQYETVHHDAVVEYRNICNGCGADITGQESAHAKDAMLNGNYACGAWHEEQRIVSNAWDEQVLVSAAWDETVTTGYRCSTCGAVK